MSHTLRIESRNRTQLKDITAEIQHLIDVEGIRNGIALIYVPHTTAAVTINENADPDVVTDMVAGLERLVPWQDNYRHGEGNSAAHIKSSLIGVSEQVIIADGKLALGTWQGIFFCEFDGPRSRQVRIKLIRG